MHEKALAGLYREAGERLHGMFFRLTLNEADAADLFQELFVRLARAEGFGAARDRRAYAFRAGLRLVANFRRGRRRTVELAGDEVDRGEGPAEGAGRREEFERLLGALDGLPEEARDAFILRHIEGEDYGRVGEVLGVTGHHARAMVHRAVRMLRVKLGVLEVRDGNGA